MAVCAARTRGVEVGLVAADVFAAGGVDGAGGVCGENNVRPSRRAASLARVENFRSVASCAVTPPEGTALLPARVRVGFLAIRLGSDGKAVSISRRNEGG